MGELIAFKARRKQSTSVAEAGPGGAEILFFTGVRYERRETLDGALQLTDKTVSERGTTKPTRRRKRRA